MLGLDIVLVWMTYFMAQLISANFQWVSVRWAHLPQRAGLLTLSYLIAFFIHKSYVGVVRLSGSKDFQRLFLSTLTALVLIIPAAYLLTLYQFSRVTLLVQSMLFLITSVGGRLAVRSLFLSLQLRKSSKGSGILIVGAGSMGRAAANAIKQESRQIETIIGFIDDNKSKTGKSVNGIPILTLEKALQKDFIEKNNLGKLVIAIKNIPASRLKEISNIAIELGLQVKRVPPISNWVNGELTAKQIRPISLEELLGRDPIQLSYETLNGFIKGKTVLVTGAAGSIGSELVRQVMKQDPKLLIALDQAETPSYHLDLELQAYSNYSNVKTVIGSVTDESRMASIFKTYSPNVIFHAAAYKHVPLMEDNPEEASKTNILGTFTTAKLSSVHKAECFVMVSTDKAVNPTNIMGASKRAAEHVVSYINRQHTNQTRFVTTRFGNVLGSNGSVIPLFKKQLEAGGPITLTHKDITRYFMTIPEAAQLVIQAGAMGTGGDVFVLDMGQPVRIFDLAKRMVELSGLVLKDAQHPDGDIEIAITGLRPGEKLYEELLSDAENTLPTHHEKILIAKVRNESITDLNESFALLFQYAIQPGSVMAMVTKMKELVPEFVSNNSIFESLDQDKAAVISINKVG